VITPKGKGTITIGLAYGTATFNHGDIMENDDIAKMFPQYFFPVPEDSYKNLPKEVQDAIKASEKKEASKVTTTRKQTAAPKQKPGPKPQNFFRGK